jgi:murein L,D-transpeptidase YafK
MKTARVTALAGAALLLAACQPNLQTANTRSQVPIPAATLALMATKGMSASDPILIRAYKKESELEVWKRGRDGRYAHLKTLPICRWSGQLGPKLQQGDRQAPEGFYAVTPAQMNPNSSYYLSFDTGYPNAYDRAHGRSGAHLMVHGACSSAGCYAMTDEAIAELYAIVREAFAGGQRAIQFQAFPFHMTAENIAKYRNDPNIAFWRNLKEGADRFEASREEPQVSVARGRYEFEVSQQGEALAAAKMARDEGRVAALVGHGTPAIRTVYADGDQHPYFRGLFAAPREISRPDALAYAGQDVPATAATTPKVAAAAAKRAPAEPIKVAAEPSRAGPAMQRNAAAASTDTARARRAEPSARMPAAPPLPPVRQVRKPGPMQTAAAAPKDGRLRVATRAAATVAPPVDARPFYERWYDQLFGSSTPTPPPRRAAARQSWPST